MIGSILGAIAPKLIGGFFQSRAQKKTHRANVAESKRASAQSYTNSIALMDHQNRINRTNFKSDRTHGEAREDRIRAEDRAIYNEYANRNDLLKIRDDALEAGYNPLTAMGLAGGVQAPTPSGTSTAYGTGVGLSGSSTFSAPPLSSSNFVGEALGAGIETLFNRDKIASDMEADSIRLEMAKEELIALKKSNEQAGARKSFGYTIPTVTSAWEMDNPKAGLSSVRPNPRPTMGSVERIPVFLPDGQQKQIPASAASRLGIEPWGYVTAGDYAELVGEVRGEVESTLAAVPIGQSVGITISGNPSKHDTKHDTKLIPPKPKGGHSLRTWQRKYGHTE